MPHKVLPTVPIKPMLQQFLLRPSKYQEFQHWRRPGADDAGKAEPINQLAEPLNAYENLPEVLGDISDGWRCAVSTWGVEDVLVEEKWQRFISLPCGLLFSINIDWFSPTKCSHAYSTSTIYVTILNNPRSKCFLAQETLLYCFVKHAYLWKNASPQEWEVKHIIQQIIVVGGMLMHWSRTNDPWKKLEKFLGSIWWPSTIASLRTNAGAVFYKTERLLRKCRRAYCAHLSQQPGEDLDLKSLPMDNLSMDWNYQQHFKAVLGVCAAIRIWMHSPLCWTKLGGLKNFMGELESTMMWSWIKNILIHDLICSLEDLNNKTADNLVAIENLWNHLKGNHKKHYSYTIELPRQGTCADLKLIDIDRTDVYCLIFAYLWMVWRSQMTGILRNDLPAMPWSDWETDLGIRTWNFNKFSEPEIIEPHWLCGHSALTEIPLPDKRRVWATISLDHDILNFKVSYAERGVAVRIAYKPFWFYEHEHADLRRYPRDCLVAPPPRAIPPMPTTTSALRYRADAVLSHTPPVIASHHLTQPPRVSHDDLEPATPAKTSPSSRHTPRKHRPHGPHHKQLRDAISQRALSRALIG
ncbi:hypothetical protein HETIRDRAFT_120128 [Heterobasidion irregulare TC 32-1]|uniref:Uncharacterized protein n=1 Tax=Heterobasidion irregulare (strain TC 32-1) TaxID=747525 RepID=W4JXJ9_HETIT|nr:uncharacterized protein HETIRDRAFT_120128 [Heterobasidion irregulare TC 32-1]ETW78268.1 hypothetical protein HETIRDRAFT_120128 [Heterobasidion irregulare TC 32-1]